MSAAPDHIAEIANLKARYCAAADLAASDVDAARKAFSGLFTDDFSGDYSTGLLHGPAAISDFLCSAISQGSEWMIHFLTSPNIMVEGDAAAGEWAVLVHSKRKDGNRMEVVGRYADAFRRTSEGWRISKVVFCQYK